VLVYSNEAAEHIAALLDAGWTRSEIARAASVSPALITKASKLDNSLNERSAAAILGVGDVVPARLTFPVKSRNL
jgi:hypothetical protein